MAELRQLGWQHPVVHEDPTKFGGRETEKDLQVKLSEYFSWPKDRSAGSLTRVEGAGPRYDKDEDLTLSEQSIVDINAGRPNTYAKVSKVYFVFLTVDDYKQHWEGRCWVDPFRYAAERNKAERDCSSSSSSSSSSSARFS